MASARVHDVEGLAQQFPEASNIYGARWVELGRGQGVEWGKRADAGSRLTARVVRQVSDGKCHCFVAMTDKVWRFLMGAS